MPRALYSLLLIACLFLSNLTLVRAQQTSPKTADLILRNAVVYTLDAARTWAEAVAIAGGRIVYVGNEGGLKPWIGPQTIVSDLQGKMLLPGFHDSHVHLIYGGIDLSECYLYDFTNQEQIL